MLKEKPEKNDAAKEIPKNMVASYGEDDVVSTGESPASVLTIADVTGVSTGAYMYHFFQVTLRLAEARHCLFTFR